MAQRQRLDHGRQTPKVRENGSSEGSPEAAEAGGPKRAPGAAASRRARYRASRPSEGDAEKAREACLVSDSGRRVFERLQNIELMVSALVLRKAQAGCDGGALHMCPAGCSDGAVGAHPGAAALAPVLCDPAVTAAPVTYAAAVTTTIAGQAATFAALAAAALAAALVAPASSTFAAALATDAARGPSAHVRLNSPGGPGGGSGGGFSGSTETAVSAATVTDAAPATTTIAAPAATLAAPAAAPGTWGPAGERAAVRVAPVSPPPPLAPLLRPIQPDRVAPPPPHAPAMWHASEEPEPIAEYLGRVADEPEPVADDTGKAVDEPEPVAEDTVVDGDPESVAEHLEVADGHEPVGEHQVEVADKPEPVVEYLEEVTDEQEPAVEYLDELTDKPKAVMENQGETDVPEPAAENLENFDDEPEPVEEHMGNALDVPEPVTQVPSNFVECRDKPETGITPWPSGTAPPYSPPAVQCNSETAEVPREPLVEAAEVNAPEIAQNHMPKAQSVLGGALGVPYDALLEEEWESMAACDDELNAVPEVVPSSSASQGRAPLAAAAVLASPLVAAHVVENFNDGKLAGPPPFVPALTTAEGLFHVDSSHVGASDDERAELARTMRFHLRYVSAKVASRLQRAFDTGDLRALVRYLAQYKAATPATASHVQGLLDALCRIQELEQGTEGSAEPEAPACP